jgi:hypothetical protein
MDSKPKFAHFIYYLILKGRKFAVQSSLRSLRLFIRVGGGGAGGGGGALTLCLIFFFWGGGGRRAGGCLQVSKF